MSFCHFVFFLCCQDDHPATEGQAPDPAEQREGIPPEIHSSVFLNACVSFFFFLQQELAKKSQPRNNQPISIYLSLLSAFPSAAPTASVMMTVASIDMVLVARVQGTFYHKAKIQLEMKA